MCRCRGHGLHVWMACATNARGAKNRDLCGGEEVQVQYGTLVRQETKARLRYHHDLPGRLRAIRARSLALAKPLQRLPPVPDTLGVSYKTGKGRQADSRGV